MAFNFAFGLSHGRFVFERTMFGYARESFSVVTLLVVAVSYIIFISNVQRSPLSQNVAAIHVEKILP